MELVGREEELSSIDAFLDEAVVGPAALVLIGEAGIGKTVLWHEGVAEAGRRSVRVLTCRGVEAEASLSFAGLSELLAPTLGEALAALAPPRRHTLAVALMLEEPGQIAPDEHVIGLAVLDVLRSLSASGPVLLAIDDLHWLDAASGRVLQVALRRLRAEPVGLLVTVRDLTTLSAPIDLERCYSEESVARLSPGPVSVERAARAARASVSASSCPDQSWCWFSRRREATRSSRSRSVASW